MSEDGAPPPRRRRIRTVFFKKRWLTAGTVVVLVGASWLAREPIADRVLRDQFASRDIPVAYTIDSIGIRSERLSNVVIGDPQRPDLTAKHLEVLIGYGWSGPYVSGVRADGVRLYGRFIDGQLSLGSLDKFRDPTDTTPFALPDLWVHLTDGRARVDTPWGNLGAVLAGSGNLRRDFTGKLGMVAPVIAAAGCSGRDISFYGTVEVRNIKPRVAGPLRGAAITCDGFTAVSPQIALDVTFAENLKRWDGSANASLRSLSGGSFAADRLGVAARFAGTAAQTNLDLSADMARLAVTDFVAQSVNLEAKVRVGAKAPSAEGSFRFARASGSAALRRSIADSAKGLEGSPFWPLANRATAAAARMLGDAGGKTDFILKGAGRDARVEFAALELTSASGARLTSSADSRLTYIFGMDQPAVLATGRWSFGGGDLPSGSIALDRDADGVLSGEASFDTYEAGGARLALAPIRFSGGGRSSILRFVTRAELSGPLAGGRVDGLSIPLAGALAPTGTLALNGGCTRVGIDRIAVSGFRLGRTGVDLCSRAGAPLLSAGPGGLRGFVRVPGLRLRGTSGSSPFAFDARNAEIDLASLRWTAALVDVRLGQGDSVTRFAAQRITGRKAAQGMAGELTSANGKIGAVPLNMDEIAGQWRFAKGALTLDGGLTLTDSAPVARFQPLVSSNASLRFAEGVIDATAGFQERKTGTKILDTVIRHHLGEGAGSADLFVRELRFNDGFQPDQLTSLALGVVANVQGSVVGDGHIDWSPAGVTSRGTFATANTNLAAAFGPVTGLTTTIMFEDLIGLRTGPGQKAQIKEINPGIPVVDGEIEYRLLGDNRVQVEGGRWPFAGGELLLHPTTLDFNADQPRRLTFDLVGVEAAVFLQNFGFDNINATGKFDGTLPVVFDGLGGRIENGRIDARNGGGTLAYVGELSNHNLGAIANFAFGALRSLKYDDLSIILNGNLDGEMVTDIRFGGIGQGEGATRNFLTNQIAKIPLVFNVKVKGPFRQLVTSAKGLYDPTVWIEQNLNQLIQQQEAATSGAATVQPPESEPVR